MGLLEFLYYAGYRVKKAYGLCRRKRLPARVISIGNMTTGGTGKTPAAIALAMEARSRGFRPCVLTRGYKGRVKGPLLVKPGMRGADTGDEPLLMAEKLGGIPVVKGARRYASGLYALKNVSPAPDVFILDDGFQHWRLHRDLDVLLISAINPFGGMRLLPMGRLREPLSRIARADAVLITRSDCGETSGLMGVIRRHNPDAPVFLSRHVPSVVRTALGGEHPIGRLSGRGVYAFSGIAEPENFIDLLLNSGADVKGSRAFRDHHVFTPREVREVREAALKAGAEWIITTEKDIMRLRGLELPENLVTLGIEFLVDREFYDFVFNPGIFRGREC